MIRFIKQKIGNFYRHFRQWRFLRWCRKHPKERAEQLYQRNFGRPINWAHPVEFNEKIRWMQFYTDTTKWTLLADKYRVRQYVTEKGYQDILVPLLGVWKRAKDINFEILPKSFVLKTNHGCGQVIIVEDKEGIGTNDIRNKMDRYLNTPFGYKTAEPHYLGISPCIIAEKLLRNDQKWSTSIVDYKFYCFHGQPHYCLVVFDRNNDSHTTKMQIYDMDWKRHDEYLRDMYVVRMPDIPRPQTFDRMLKACQDLASEFPFVRMDFYESEGNLYFGELSFTPAACSRGQAFNDDCCRNLVGPLIVLPSTRE